MMRVAPLLLSFQILLGLSPCRAQVPDASVLADGEWHRFAVTEDGIYRLSGHELSSWGIDLSTVATESIRVFGRGGGMLPQALSAPRIYDLPEVAIWVEDGGDGVLHDDDYLLFFGQSPHDRYFDADGSGNFQPVYHKNLYSDTTYYFLGLVPGEGKRVATAEAPAAAVWSTDYYQELLTHEEETENILNGSGREWYGPDLRSGESDQAVFAQSGWRSEKPVQVYVRMLGRSVNPADVQASLNGASLGTIKLDPVLSGTYSQKGKSVESTFTVDPGTLSSSANTSVTVALSGSGAKANLDQLIITGARTLALPAPENKPLVFSNLESINYATTQFSLVSDRTPVVWDVSDPLIPVAQPVTASGDRWTFPAATAGKVREFAAASEQEWLTPVYGGAVANQDLKGGGVPDFLVITRDDLRAEAERLVDFRRTYSQLDGRVVTKQQIFNEFSSGAQDVTAMRNYIKYLYDRQPGKLQAVLLLGKGSYDYKNFTSGNTNVVPIYQSRNSVHPIYSYSSDDYFGFLEDDEGEWEESFAGDHTLDIGVGRLPVKNREEARIAIDKIIHYQSDASTLGPWRNEVVFVADDGDNDKHQRDAEQLAKFVDTSYTSYSIQKIYTDAFPQEKLPGGEIAPDVSQQIEDAIKQGALIVNYTGHGSETRWAQEKILDVGMINQFRNRDRLPFFVTATCEFGRHDDPQQISGAEQLILNPEGGAIGLVTTARPVFSNSNFLLNRAFYREVFKQEDGAPLSLGEIFRRTKNDGLNGQVNRNFSLLGDPTLVLAYPQEQITIGQLAVRQANGAFAETDTLRALDYVRLTGTVISPVTGQLAPDFSGTVALEVLDKTTLRRTQGNEGTFMQFEERNSVIHRGNARVTNGQFTLDFVMPKNIVYQTGQGRITAYAEASGGDAHYRDAHGALVTFAIGGSRPATSSDTAAPRMQLYLDDTTFVDGGYTDTNTLMLARLEDESGISISTSGLGQQLVAELTREETGEKRTFPVNDFYQTDLGEYQSGWVRYPIQNLEEGRYRLTLQAWDTHNNEGLAQVRFRVGPAEELLVTEFYNYPNPFSEETRFVLNHNRPGHDLFFTLRVVNSRGEVVFEGFSNPEEVATRLDSLVWDGRTTSGEKLPSGMYIAQVVVRVPDLQIEQQKTHQLIIVH